MKTHFLFFLFIIWGYTVVAQEVKVVDSSTKDGVPFAIVFNSSQSVSTTTDEKGVFNLKQFTYTDSIVVRSLGFETTATTYSNLILKPKIMLNRKAFNLEAVQVSALRWRLNPNDIPNKIYSINQKDVFIQQPQTAADLLSVSNKVFIQKSQMGGGSPMIRGFSSNRLLYSVDGIRMNTAIFRDGNVHNVISLDPFAIEESEIMLGPGSVLYGSDALGGVLRFETLKPKFKLDSGNSVSGNLSSRYSSANFEKTIHLDVNVGAKKWAFLSSYTATDFNHLKMGANGPEEFLQDTFAIRFQNEDALATPRNNKKQIKTAYHQQNFMQKVAYRKDSIDQFQYAFHYSETSDIPRYDRLIQRRNGKLRYAEWYYGPQKWMMHHINWKSDKSRFYSDHFNLDIAYQRFEESRNSRSLNSVDLSLNVEQVDAYSINFDLIKSFSSQHKLTYGLETILNTVNSEGRIQNITNGISTVAASRYPNAKWWSNAIYVNDIYSLSNISTLNIGVRYNQFNINTEFDTSLFPYPETESKLSFGAVTASIGLSHQPSQKTLLSLLISNGFRAPNIDDLGKVFDSEPGSVVVPNTGLNSEKVYNFEVGIKQSLAAKILLDFSAYYTILDDAIVRRNDNYQGNDSIVYQGELSQVQSLQNASSANIYGFNLGIQYSFNKNLKLKGNYNLQNGEENVDGVKSPIRHMSPNFGNIALFYTIKHFTFNLDYQFSEGFDYDELNIGEQAKSHLYAIDSDGNPYSPSWYSLNLGVAYKSKKALSWYFGIDNISNQRYRTYSSGIAAAGRNFIASMNYKF